MNELNRDVEQHAEGYFLSPVAGIIRHPAQGYIGENGLRNGRYEENNAVGSSTSAIDLIHEVPESKYVQENTEHDD